MLKNQKFNYRLMELMDEGASELKKILENNGGAIRVKVGNREYELILENDGVKINTIVGPLKLYSLYPLDLITEIIDAAVENYVIDQENCDELGRTTESVSPEDAEEFLNS